MKNGKTFDPRHSQTILLAPEELILRHACSNLEHRVQGESWAIGELIPVRQQVMLAKPCRRRVKQPSPGALCQRVSHELLDNLGGHGSRNRSLPIPRGISSDDGIKGLGSQVQHSKRSKELKRSELSGLQDNQVVNDQPNGDRRARSRHVLHKELEGANNIALNQHTEVRALSKLTSRGVPHSKAGEPNIEAAISLPHLGVGALEDLLSLLPRKLDLQHIVQRSTTGSPELIEAITQIRAGSPGSNKRVARAEGAANQKTHLARKASS